jgi:8-amino-7-oxononanoate synthase
LVIDEAHATGVFGVNGRGLTTFIEGQENVIALHTCGKALGVAGALVCLNKTFYDYFINRARMFIYSTAPSPLIAVAVTEALKILVEEPHHRDNLEALYTYANNEMYALSGLMRSGSQILPITIAKNDFAVRLASRMQTEGYDIRAIRPPTVPEGTARLRISITLHVSKKDITRMFTQLFTLIEEEKQ